LDGWVAGEFQVGEADAADDQVVGGDVGWRRETYRALAGDVIVLIDAVAADS
jgi:hypothetical protein